MPGSQGRGRLTLGRYLQVVFPRAVTIYTPIGKAGESLYPALSPAQDIVKNFGLRHLMGEMATQCLYIGISLTVTEHGHYFKCLETTGVHVL